MENVGKLQISPDKVSVKFLFCIILHILVIAVIVSNNLKLTHLSRTMNPRYRIRHETVSNCCHYASAYRIDGARNIYILGCLSVHSCMCMIAVDF